MADLVATLVDPEPAPREPFAPMRLPLIVTQDQLVLAPDAFVQGLFSMVPLTHGVGFAWAPLPGDDGIVLIAQGGNPAEPSGEMLASWFSRAVLRAMIADLQSIDAQLGDAP